MIKKALDMVYVEATGLQYIEEEEAQGEIAEIYEAVKREMQQPDVPNIIKVVANSHAALASYWNMISTFYKTTILPESLVAMLFYTVANANNCQYCSAGHEVTCRTLGIDEDTLNALVKDLGNVSPERIRAIIEFAVKVARDPKGLNAQDYEMVRDQGVTDEEIVEIIFVASMGNFGDTVADALKVPVDASVSEALGRS
jgi:uncharacterized peroxidase-related enzyme